MAALMSHVLRTIALLSELRVRSIFVRT